MRGLAERRHAAIGRLLPADSRHNILVPEGVLRTGNRRRRMDGKCLVRCAQFVLPSFPDVIQSWSVHVYCIDSIETSISITSIRNEHSAQKHNLQNYMTIFAWIRATRSSHEHTKHKTAPFQISIWNAFGEASETAQSRQSAYVMHNAYGCCSRPLLYSKTGQTCPRHASALLRLHIKIDWCTT